MDKKTNTIAKMWFGMLVYTYFIMLWGTFVRASRSGAGCGQSWPHCDGGYFFDIQNLPQIIEYIHRLSSGLYGLFALALVVWTIKKGTFAKYGWMCLCFLALVFFEAWIGRTLVVHSLVVDDQRILRLVWMGLHFLNTLVLVTSLVLLWLTAKEENGESVQTKVWKRLKNVFCSPIVWAFLSVCLLGIITAFYDTTVISGQMPQEGLPDWVQKLRIVHPFVAVIFVLTLVYGYFQSDEALHGKNVLLTVLILNLILGGVNVLFHHYTFLQVGHVLITHLIWLLLISDLLRTNHA